ncbi:MULTISPECIES: response regulator transcription factor [Pseudofrankia]|uniref:response regulator transcription factor n=1 Tax=Pseudofrankia TaxID=2994363 RepID=UPI000234C17B|nr:MULTISPECIES: response regulator transcription factor [Pseudofrankia]OHV42038.1 DNA-binding response regulator [Pseudofrankia sp. EUN1h]
MTDPRQTAPPGATGGPAAPVRVLVVDDDPLVRAALAMVFGGGDEVALVGEAGDGDEVLAAVEAHGPDVVLMDIRMPRVDGLAATEALRARADPPEVLVLTTFDTDEHVLRALRAGASGFLLKDTPPAEIIRAIRRVAAGDPILSPAVLRRLMAHAAASSAATPAAATDSTGASPPAFTPGASAAPRASAEVWRARTLLDQLSEREREVALAVGRGLSNAQIAAELYMSVATVKSYVSKLFVRLGLDNRVQIALLVHDAHLDAG